MTAATTTLLLWKPIPEAIAKEFLNGEKGVDPLRTRYFFFSHDGERTYPRLMLRVNEESAATARHSIFQVQCCLKREAGDWVERVALPPEVYEYLTHRIGGSIVVNPV